MIQAKWQQPIRVIQTNLQVKDTARIDPERLADQLADLGADALVYNVGGIYAWYRSQVDGHHINEYLPEQKDLLRDVISACHSRGLLFIGRFDFSKAQDEIYLRHPDWFARNSDLSPRIIGATRPGNWPLLYLTCMQSPYQKDAVAVPVLREVLENYDLDAVFFNAPFPNPCWCDRCRRLYRDFYGQSLPEDSGSWQPDWTSRQMSRHVPVLTSAIRSVRPDIPTILYYWDDQVNQPTEALTELVCDESQNILSRGRKNLSADWTPAVRMQLCRIAKPGYPPFGIIHSSPGMDWRHTGLPESEYRFWLSQVAANGGSLWHSLTGVPDTIGDRRILDCVRDVNARAGLACPLMDEAEPWQEAGLLWETSVNTDGWLQPLTEHHIPYTLVRPGADDSRWPKCQVLIVPAGYPWSATLLAELATFVHNGGNLIVEGKLPNELPDLHRLCGIQPDQVESEPLAAAYLRLEELEADFLSAGSLARTALLPFRGQVAYSNPDGESRILATLVPPFAPLEAVGAPPERASLAVEKTEIPLLVSHMHGQGRVFYLPFSLADLVSRFGLADHLQLAAWLIRSQIPQPRVEISSQPGLLLTIFENQQQLILHLVNGIGKRPLSALAACTINITVRHAHDQQIGRIHDLFSNTEISWQGDQGQACFTLNCDEAWKTVVIDYQPAD